MDKNDKRPDVEGLLAEAERLPTRGTDAIDTMALCQWILILEEKLKEKGWIL